MGKAKERCGVDCIVVLQESLIWFEGCPWLSDRNGRMAAGFFVVKSPISGYNTGKEKRKFSDINFGRVCMFKAVII